MLNICADFLDPFAKIIGLDGVILIAFILGFPANEIVIPIVIMAYTSGSALSDMPALEGLRDILVSNGYAENYLEPHFACDKCKDEGFIELNNKTIACECFKKLLSACACEELNKVSPLTLSTFDTFNLSYYSDKPDDKGNIPYVRMSKIYDYCLNYANNTGEVR